MDSRAQAYIEYVESLKAEAERKKQSQTDVLPDWLVPIDQSKCSLRWAATFNKTCTGCGNPAYVTVRKDPQQIAYCLDCGLNKALSAERGLEA